MTIKFDTYRKCDDHLIRQYLREMTNMIYELKSAGHVLTNEQRVRAVTRSLPKSQENVKVNITLNDNIKIFDGISYHIELKDECLEAAKSSRQLYIAESYVRKGTNDKCERGNKRRRKDKDSKNPKQPRKKPKKEYQAQEGPKEGQEQDQMLKL